MAIMLPNLSRSPNLYKVQGVYVGTKVIIIMGNNILLFPMISVNEDYNNIVLSATAAWHSITSKNMLVHV